VAATRRLAAIMFTDTVGYAASTQTDEARTLELLRQQEEIVRPLLTAHHGREIKSTGDGFLVEFDSALKATQCAVDIQRRLYERNAQEGLAPIQIRIGIHLGDVEQRGTDILGDAVNIAARVEPIAEAGGICLSGAVHEQVWNKIPDKLEKLPPTSLKGLRVPLDIYRVVLPWTVREPPSASSGPTRLAVLPFANISPDPKDEYFADGLTEELISVLSQLRELRVIARTSVSLYKSTPKSVSQIGTELGVSAVLEGSVRKAGDQLRIAVQLIDVATQVHTWANTYDRKLDNVFAVQTEIAKRVAKQLKVNVRATEEARLNARPTVRPASYLAYLKGRALLHDMAEIAERSATTQAAKEQFELAISLDPKNAAAHSGLADVTHAYWWTFPGVARAELDATSRRLVAHAIELDPNLAEAHASLGIILWDDFEYAAAEKEFKLALSLNPSYSRAHYWYAGLLGCKARTDEALLEYTLAEVADPLWVDNLGGFAEVLGFLGRLDEALVKIRKIGELRPDSLEYHAALLFYHATRSDLRAAAEEADRYIKLDSEPEELRWKPVQRALYYALSGEKEKSLALLRQEETSPEFPDAGTWIMIWAYAELHDLDGCFRSLERAFQTHSGMGLLRLRLDPRLEHVRSDPRFQALLKKMNLA
jgi:adenylate cyclase